jgi:type I restriction enzyme M protein
MLFGDGVCARIKEALLKEFNLHTIVRLPKGVFSPYADIPTNLLFFDRTHPTATIWYYDHLLPVGRKSYTKMNALRYEEFTACLAWWAQRSENDRAWEVPVEQVLKYDVEGRLLSANLDIKNPNSKMDFDHLPPEQLVENIIAKHRKSLTILDDIKTSLGAVV